MEQQKIAVLFPGQGSQFLGMGHEFFETREDARLLMEQAEEISRAPIGRLCKEGPMEELTLAHHLQPALTVTSLMCWQALRETNLPVAYFAGHSLGEYSALCAAEVVSEEDTLRLVAERGRLMGQAGEENPGRMCAILGLDFAAVTTILEELNRPDALSIGNYNSAQQIVLSGTGPLIEQAMERALQIGGKAIPLNVSVANHSPLMANAVPHFEKFMEGISFTAPRIPLFFNVTGATETDPVAIRTVMAAQIKSMVRWLNIIQGLLAEGVNVFIEVGPKKVLSGLMKRIVPKNQAVTCLQFDTPDGLETVLKKLSAL